MVASRKMREAPRPTGAKLGAPALGAIHLRSKFFWFVTVDIHVGSDDVTIRQRGLVAICPNLVSVMFPKTLLSKTARVQKIWGKKSIKWVLFDPLGLDFGSQGVVDQFDLCDATFFGHCAHGVRKWHQMFRRWLCLHQAHQHFVIDNFPRHMLGRSRWCCCRDSGIDHGGIPSWVIYVFLYFGIGGIPWNDPWWVKTFIYYIFIGTCCMCLAWCSLNPTANIEAKQLPMLQNLLLGTPVQDPKPTSSCWCHFQWGLTTNRGSCFHPWLSDWAGSCGCIQTNNSAAKLKILDLFFLLVTFVFEYHQVEQIQYIVFLNKEWNFTYRFNQGMKLYLHHTKHSLCLDLKYHKESAPLETSKNKFTGDQYRIIHIYLYIYIYWIVPFTLKHRSQYMQLLDAE